jgi:hypothetical protein
MVRHGTSATTTGILNPGLDDRWVFGPDDGRSSSRRILRIPHRFKVEAADGVTPLLARSVSQDGCDEGGIEVLPQDGRWGREQRWRSDEGVGGFPGVCIVQVRHRIGGGLTLERTCRNARHNAKGPGGSSH